MISGIVLTKNEEQNIEKCLSSLTWVDEIIVIDDYSTDETVEIAKRHKAKIYKRPLDNDFSSQRNFALSKATSDWVFFVDADEKISEELKNEIIGLLNFSSAHDAYRVKRLDIIWGKTISHGEQGKIRLIRLFKKEKGKWAGRVHEEVRVNGAVGSIRNPIIHYPHSTISEFLREINFYSTIRAEELFSKKKKTNWILILSYPLAKFIKNYFVKLGVLDGIRGLILAVIMSLHSFLSRGKLWLLWRKK
jgi:glycosyltransferase involved in cell wall biosynthesis